MLPENVRKAFGFLTFSGSIEVEHWAKMGERDFETLQSSSF